MADKKKADKAREIPIEDGTEQAAAAAEPAPAEPEVVEAQVIEDVESQVAEGAQAAQAGEPSIVDEAEAVVADAAAVDAERLAKAEADAAAMRDRYLRLQAEWDNYRKRTAEEAGEMRIRATERLMNDVLPVLDDFERAIAHASANGEAGLLDGVKAISAKLAEVLGKHGLVALDPAGQPFDALEHQAVAQVPDAEAFDETVAQVYQKGYKLGKKVLRPAMVTITTGGPKRPAETDDK